MVDLPLLRLNSSPKVGLLGLKPKSLTVVFMPLSFDFEMDG